MKKFLLLLISFSLLMSNSVYSQTENAEDTKTEKTKVKDKLKSGTFITDTENSKDYKKEDRDEISPVMPKYDVRQDFQNGKKKTEQQSAYKNKKYFYPAKPQNAWQIGLFTGLSTMAGDVDANFLAGNKPMIPGFNMGLLVSKSWSYVLSTRVRYSAFTMYTNDATASTLTREFINGTNRYNDISLNTRGYSEGQQFFHNSRTQSHDLNFDLVFALGNLNFHKERTKVNFKVFPSVGMMMYQTFYDHADANGNAYAYNDLINLNELGQTSRSEVIKSLSAIRDGKYETRAEEHTVRDEKKILGYTPRITLGIGAGVTFRLSKWIYLDIESRQTLTKDDLLDGMQWEEPLTTATFPISRGLTQNFDSYNQTTVGLTFNLLGKNTTEPLFMLNPMHFTYQKLAEADPEKAIDDLLQDDDGDGVPNRLDEEEGTVEGAPVSSRGIALDSDKDGIIDFHDDEPFTAPDFLASVDAKGVAKSDENFKGKVENIVNNMSISNSSSGGGMNCDALSIELPSVHFDKDKYNIKPEYYSHIHEVAQRMLMCPASKVLATGYADKDNNSKYNEQLSYNRVDNTIDYLVEKYGIDRNRFIVKYNGESAAKGNSSTEQYEDRKVGFKLVESETGESNPSAPHPGMKAGRIK